MLTLVDIQRIIAECRIAGARGLGNGSRALIQELHVDVLTPPADFLGVKNNPAIFVNQDTYCLLGKYHPTWEVNKTIAVKEGILEKNPVMVIGIIVHEAGHAFNIAAKIVNSEVNAYIFEIEVISMWFKTKNPLFFACSREELQAFFHSRLPFYRAESRHSHYLVALIKDIETNRIFDPPSIFPSPSGAPKTCRSPRCVMLTPKVGDSNPLKFFKHEASHPSSTGSEEPLSEGDLTANAAN